MSNVEILEETKKSKIFDSIDFYFRLSKSKEDLYVRFFLKNEEKAIPVVSGVIQRMMRKKSDDIITGDFWHEEYESIKNVLFAYLAKRVQEIRDLKEQQQAEVNLE